MDKPPTRNCINETLGGFYMKQKSQAVNILAEEINLVTPSSLLRP